LKCDGTSQAIAFPAEHAAAAANVDAKKALLLGPGAISVPSHAILGIANSQTV